jgi:hypothetical protein
MPDPDDFRATLDTLGRLIRMALDEPAPTRGELIRTLEVLGRRIGIARRQALTEDTEEKQA